MGLGFGFWNEGLEFSTQGLVLRLSEVQNANSEGGSGGIRAKGTVGMLAPVCLQSYLTESVYKVVLQKSIPAQIRQLILCICNDEG